MKIMPRFWILLIYEREVTILSFSSTFTAVFYDVLGRASHVPISGSRIEAALAPGVYVVEIWENDAVVWRNRLISQ